jgi:hypothetical protein
LLLRSNKGSVLDGSGLCFRFKAENIGRLLGRGGEEICGPGEDGGVDRGGSSENISVISLGLDGGSAEFSRTGEELRDEMTVVAWFARSVSLVFFGVSTRLRFVGGSASYNECFLCRE